MKAENAIEVKQVKKSFKIYYDKGYTLKEKLLSCNRRKYEERIVLNEISFEVKKGEAIGLIGENGCGKSTTLKLLTKIMYPDAGSIVMKGRVSSLIELGAGFHPDMSGRENIYINASIFGLTKKEIYQRMESIITFSELEEFIDNPVRTYSSGMYMRLAFSVAIHVDADILLIDEILAVGDAAFQAKCFQKLKEIKQAGTTIVIVSHSLGQIEQICERSIWIQEGIIKEEGIPRIVHMNYLDYMEQKRQKTANHELELELKLMMQKEKKEKKEKEEKESTEEKIIEEPVEKKRWGNKKAKICNVCMLNKEGKEQLFFSTGEEIEIKIDFSVKEKVEHAVFGIGIFRLDGLQCYGTNTRIDRLEPFDLIKDGSVSIKIKELNLMKGHYLLDAAIESDYGIPVDYYREVLQFEIGSMIEDVGVARLSHCWKLPK